MAPIAPVRPAPGEAAPSRLVARLSAPGTIVAVWIGHGVLFTVLLALLMPTLAHVDANSADILQKAFAPAYQVKNPPIYEWLELLVQAVVGPGPASFLVVRYALMGAIGLAVHGVVLELSESRPAAAAASYGLMSFYWFAWYFHDSISHSILVALACVAFLWAAIVHLRRPSPRSAIVLALVSGLGIAAKYNFLILLAGSLVVIASDRRLRPALRDARLLLVPLAALLIAGPIMVAADRVGPGLVGTLERHVAGDEPHGLLVRLFAGGKLVVVYALFLLPWAALAAHALRPAAGGRPVLRMEDVGERFVVRLAVVLPLLAILGVMIVGARPETLSERYLFPLLFAVPVAVHAVAGRQAPAERQLRVFAGFALAVLVVVVGIRLLDAATATRPGGENKRFQPFDRLADILADRGLGAAFFITPDRWESGQLNAALPEARAAGLVTQRRWTPMSYPDGGRCVLFWLDRSRAPADPVPPGAVPEALQRFAPAGATIETADVPWRGAFLFGPRSTSFHWIDLGTGAEACRTVFGAAR